MNEQHLIYGKNEISRIVGLEVNDNVLELYRELPDGTIDTQIRSNKFWLLSSEPLRKDWKRLKGDLHYKWGQQFDNRKEFLTTKYFAKKNNKDTYSLYDSTEAIMIKDGYTMFKNMKMNEVSILTFDIETTTLDHNDNAKLLLISNTFRRNGKIEKKLFAYDAYENEGLMIEAWSKWVKEKNPAILCGHNIFGFDLPYLQFIADRYNVPICLGRNDDPMTFDKYESKFRKDQTNDLHYHKARVYGREIIDTLFLAIKYDIATKKYESYALKRIISQEGLEKQDRVFYPADQIRHKYKILEEWEKIKAYCVDDADDSLALFDLMASPFFYMCQSVPKSFESLIQSATGSQINSVMMRAYLQDAHSLPKANPETAYEGAISIGNPGIFHNVWKVDVASLYPSIMIEYEVFDKEKDPMEYFKKLVCIFTERRLEYKKKAKEDKYYDDLQAAYKIFINSCYGFLGTGGLLFNSPLNAAFITKKGREILNQAIAWAEGLGFQLVNADTDSISISQKNGEYITEDVRETLLQSLCSLYPKRISWEDDGYYKSIIVVKAKNYVMQKENGKIVTKGSALKASTKEVALKEFIQEIIQSILENKQNYLDVYEKYVTEALDLKDMSRWATRKTISDKTLNSERKNESKIRDAIKHTELVEGDRAYFFFRRDGTLSLMQEFNGDYSVEKLLKKLHDTVKIFSTVIDIAQFPNYSLKRHKEELNEFRQSLYIEQENQYA